VSILDRYLLGRYLKMLPLCVVAAGALFLLVDFFTRVGDLAQNDSGVSSATAYFAFKLPRILTQVYPAASLFAVLIGVGALAVQQEVLAMHACGVGSRRILLPLTLASIMLSVLVLGWNETVVPPASSRARMILDQGIKKKLETGIYNASTIWFQTDAGLLNIDYFDALHNVLYGITLHEMDENFRLQNVVKVPQAVWDGGQWSLRGGTVTSFLENGDMVIREAGAGDLRLDVAPDDLRRKRRRAYEFSYGELRSQIFNLENKGLDATEYVVDLHYKLAAPFAGVVALLLGFPLAVRAGQRGGGILRNVGVGLGLSFAYWSATALSVAAGHTGSVPPVIAAWAPNTLFGLGGAALYLGRDV
jgi:lipopolysaccharide export system permease protein